MRIEIHHFLHQDPEDDSKVIKLLRQVLNINNNIMSKVEDLSAKVDQLQTTIDDTQSQFIIKMATLEATIQELKDQIETGNDPALDAIIAKVDAATADLKSTFPEEPEEPQV